VLCPGESITIFVPVPPSNVKKGVTPVVIELKRKEKNLIVRVEKSGYEPVEIPLVRKADGWIFGNIVFGGLIGLAIDFGTGAAYKLTPEEINATLLKLGLNPQDYENSEIMVVVDLQAVEG
jgi:hypothetical protein